MTVDISDTDGYVCASITNNGKLPEQKSNRGGGLGALRRRIEAPEERWRWKVRRYSAQHHAA